MSAKHPLGERQGASEGGELSIYVALIKRLLITRHDTPTRGTGDH